MKTLVHQVIWTVTTCNRCGCEVVSLKRRPPKYCRCCGLVVKRQYRPSTVQTNFNLGTSHHG